MNNNQNVTITNSSGVTIGSIANASPALDKPQKMGQTSSNKAHLKELIGKNKFTKSLDIIVESYSNDSDVLDNAVLLRSQFTHLRDEKIKGVINDSNYILERNKLHAALLALIDSLE